MPSFHSAIVDSNQGASREGRFAEKNLEGVDLVARKKDAQPIYVAGRQSVRVARRAGRESRAR